MAKPRPQKTRTWTQADHEDNARRIQRDADRKTWERLGRSAGLRGGELVGALSRMFDDRIAAALRTMQPTLLQQITSPATAEALRGALVDLISEDVVEIFQILTGRETQDESRDTEETPGRGGENATYEQRDFYQDEAQEV